MSTVVRSELVASSYENDRMREFSELLAVVGAITQPPEREDYEQNIRDHFRPLEDRLDPSRLEARQQKLSDALSSRSPLAIAAVAADMYLSGHVHPADDEPVEVRATLEAATIAAMGDALHSHGVGLTKAQVTRGLGKRLESLTVGGYLTPLETNNMLGVVFNLRTETWKRRANLAALLAGGAAVSTVAAKAFRSK